MSIRAEVIALTGELESIDLSKTDIIVIQIPANMSVDKFVLAAFNAQLQNGDPAKTDVLTVQKLNPFACPECGKDKRHCVHSGNRGRRTRRGRPAKRA